MLNKASLVLTRMLNEAMPGRFLPGLLNEARPGRFLPGMLTRPGSARAGVSTINQPL